MRIMTLLEMLTMLRHEARISPNVAHGVHATPGQKEMLRRTQEDLFEAHDWPVLRTSAAVEIQPGQRYATYPPVLAYPGITHAHASDRGGHWRPLVYGIEAEHLNIHNSDAGAQAPEIERWAHYLSPAAETIHGNMIEVWPVPNRPVTIRFSGKRALLPLIEDHHTSTIDGPLIVLHAAAEILAGQKAEDAQMKLAKAQARLDFLRRRQRPPNPSRLNMAVVDRGPWPRRGLDYMD